MKDQRVVRTIAVVVAILAGLNCEARAQQRVTTAEARAIAKEAYIYGFPLVESYRLQYAYFVDSTSKAYRGEWNKLHNEARVFTPADKDIRTPNPDTCDSMLGADLRAEPLVITVPAFDKNRYYSLQFIDAYTFNFAYVGSRSTGNDPGNYLLVGPNWNGEKPEGINEIIHCETEFALVKYRTQLFNSEDLDNVKKIQAGYRVQLLSTFLGQPAPKAPLKISFPKPLPPDTQRTSIEFFSLLNFVMSYCPLNLAEAGIRVGMADLGIRGDDSFNTAKWSPEIKKAVEEGIADAWTEFDELTEDWESFPQMSIRGYGTREHLEGNYLQRMVAAASGIYGDSAEESIEVRYLLDYDHDPLDATHYRYALLLNPNSNPPVNAFWSLTMYELAPRSLVANPMRRYFINSSMSRKLKRSQFDELSLYLMHDSPGKEKESNWLPAPKGPFMVVLRLYWPTKDALDSNWDIPDLKIKVSLEDKVETAEVISADSEENFARQIKPLVAGIAKATSVTIYEGLPHQRRETRALIDELRLKKTVELHDFSFYNFAISTEPAAAKKIIDFLGQAATFGRYKGAKFCGGFHPDWCIEFKNGVDVYQLLVCFGCHEVRLYGPDNKVFSDLDKGTMTALEEILKPYQKNRPKPIKKKGMFGK